MTPYETVRTFINLEYKDDAGISEQRALELIPFGWQPFVNLMYRFLDTWPGKIIGIKVERGRLRFVGKDTIVTPFNYTDAVAYRLSGLTGHVCMLDGGWGIRRKTIKGWPSLNFNNYVTCYNEAAEYGEILYGGRGSD